MSTVRIATRGSDLALAQAGAIADRIRKELDAEAELLVIRTSGDRIQDRPLREVGGKGLFVKELEEALLAGKADMAVHSAKDLPAGIPQGLVLAAFPERADPRDALVARTPDLSLGRLRERARVGTGSTRRTAQLLALRSDLEIVPLRGNVPTRIAKLESERLDAVVLACAGLDRLGLGEFVRERIAAERMLPAVGQGTLALEAVEGSELAAELAALDDAEAALTLSAERAVLTRLEADCSVPLAAYAVRDDEGRLWLRALLASPDGRRTVSREERAALSGDAAACRREASALGDRVAVQLLENGGRAILDALESHDGGAS
jgi:hydroxymethylbilane synthase